MRYRGLEGRERTSEESFDSAAEAEGNEMDALRLLGGGAEGLGGKELREGRREQRRHHGRRRELG